MLQYLYQLDYSLSENNFVYRITGKVSRITMLPGKEDGHKELPFARKKEIPEGITALGDEDMAKAVGITRNWCPSHSVSTSH